MSVNKNMWPVSNEKPEDAMFAIILDSEELLFKSENIIKGSVFIQLKDTGETINFKRLHLCLKENVSLPEIECRKKNVITHVLEEKVLLDVDCDIYLQMLSDLNESKDLRIPFEFYLPTNLSSSFNSTHVTICYELKAELQELYLCGELCDVSTTLPIEIVETYKEDQAFNPYEFENQEPTAQIQEAIDGELVTFYASMKKELFHADDEIIVDFYLDGASANMDVIMQFEVLQFLQLKDEEEKTRIIISFKKDFQPAETGILLDKQKISLQNSLLNTQPSVNSSVYVTVNYLVHIVACFDDASLELSIPINIKRKNSLRKMYPPALSTTGVPLLPLTVTVNELKNDGLQSYIPMKQCYENKRLTVKKGNINGPKALLTIISESYKAYTKEDKIKGFVYFSVSDCTKDIKFDKLLILLVGVRRYKQSGTINKNGEMFLFERKVLRGSSNNNCSIVMLPKPSGVIVVEFEFDLSTINKILPPSFSSHDVSIAYELKADIFNLNVDGKKSSLYTRLPIIMKEDKLQNKIDLTESISNICTKELFISLNIDKCVYQHKDDIIVNISLENKLKKQTTVRIQLVQFTRCLRLNNIIKETPVSKPILFLILPKSKLVSTEKISLKDPIFHYQPTLANYDEVSVTYSVIVNTPDQPHRKLSIPIGISRRHGHTITELSREGYPLLPITLEFYSQCAGDIPSYLENYSSYSLVTILKSESCFERWKGWRLK